VFLRRLLSPGWGWENPDFPVGEYPVNIKQQELDSLRTLLGHAPNSSIGNS
jgi:hypothetical protein